MKYTYAEYKALMQVMGAEPGVKVENRINRNAIYRPAYDHHWLEENEQFRYNNHTKTIRHLKRGENLSDWNWHDWGTRKGCCK